MITFNEFSEGIEFGSGFVLILKLVGRELDDLLIMLVADLLNANRSVARLNSDLQDSIEHHDCLQF